MNSGASSGGFRRGLRRGPDHLFQQLFKVFEARGGNNDCVAPATHIFRDPQETAARILFEGKEKSFALDLDLVGFQRVLIDGRFWRAVGSAAVRR